MISRNKTGFFTKHAKSSAALISLGIHLLIILLGVSFVVVSVIQKQDRRFEAKPVDRPRMRLKKLQVPVNIRKPKKAPKLRQRIQVNPNINRNMPDIKMPEIAGVKGGLGGIGEGLGGKSGIGFTMPEIKLFGVKSRGEKVFIILDSSGNMMVDEVGGMRAYTLIKNELVNILDALHPAMLFNIAVFDGKQSFVLFNKLVPATEANVDKVDAWLKPLNAVSAGMAADAYGTRTLGPAGIELTQNNAVEPIKETREWSRAVLLAMEQQADTIYLLVRHWGHLYHVKEKSSSQWSESRMEKFQEKVQEAYRLLAEENKKRAEKGEPPRVIQGPYATVRTYFPGIEFPPGDELERYEPEDLLKAMYNGYKRSTSYIPTKSGFQRNPFTFNVIHFVTLQAVEDEGTRFLKKMASSTKGGYQDVAGLEAVQAYIGGN